MATQYQKGQRFEYRVRDHYREHGFYVVKSAGSKGKADLVALRAGSPPHLVQCKAGAIASRERKEATELAALAEKLGCVGVLASKDSRGRLILQHASSLESFLLL